MNITRVADRYELLDEMPHVTGGRLFRARDHAFAEMVGVRLLGPQCGLEPWDRRRLESAIRRLQRLPHPHLMRLYSLDLEAGVLVQQWVQGISLLDLLRRRRELTAGEVFALLAELPVTLDFLAGHGVPRPKPLLGKLFIQFDRAEALDNAAATPVDDWPPFTLKLNPLSLRNLLASPDGETTNTVVRNPQARPETEETNGPQQFAKLLYELLGGRVREVDGRRYSPLSALRESGNAVLRRALIAVPQVDCQTLWEELLDAQPAAVRKPAPRTPSVPPIIRILQIPEPLLAAPHPGLGLRLQPNSPATVPIHLVARPRFTIGRSLQQADFPTRLQPEDESNELLTNRLSRVHALLETVGGELRVRDGNGSGPSLNGTSLDGHPLLPDRPAPLTHRALLELGEEYALELIPLLHAPPRTFSIGNIGEWPQPETSSREPLGALVCQPARGQPILRHGVWLFTEVGFGVDCCDRVVWDTRNFGESPAAFHHHRGSFWLRNRSLPETTLACNDTPLRCDEVAPLFPGQTVRIGVHHFTVEMA